MSTQHVERDLVALLHRHAEDAMNDTDTQTELQAFRDAVAGPAGTRPRIVRWLAIGAAAALVVVAVTAVALWGPGPAERPEPAPAVPGQDRAADRATAEEFAAAYADLDADRMADLMADGVQPWDTWRSTLQRDVAWDVERMMQPCRRTAEATEGVVFTCPYSMHLRGSEEVGRGPFGDNTVEVVVQDGEVTLADYTQLVEFNGVTAHLAKVDRWIAESHPEDVAFLRSHSASGKTVDLGLSESEWSRWTRLTQRYTDEYVADVRSGS
ncbi:hypothetical protein [Nocardioides euryhalodurans]|uniref:Uncharacterized protein n=1 Tax=Nocardioides euryhalodurans TaxID=2518370 RepID=A0A4P7GNQ5_9ACTN|nr:hypothetical protein [Nocardioides euryhalodurans]QBR93856.1 hypothetical protein EXE57_17385 [Nocardioides euryhalodurans]